MPRKKKEASVINKEPSDSEIEYALKFAKEYFGQNGGIFGNMFGVYNPSQTNSIMQSVSFNPAIATSEKIEEALSNPKSSEKQLLEYGQNLEVQSMLYKRILLYMSRMLSYDLNYVCINTDVDYNSPQYKKDKNAVINFFDKFDYVDEFQKIMDVLVREEVFFGVFRKDGYSRYGIQQLPSNYCLITGRTPGRILFDFSMAFFLNSGIDINMFPDIFKVYYEKAFSGKGSPNNYIPSAPLNDRDGSWAYYVQTDPEIFWGFKLFQQLTTRIPLFAAMYPDIVLQPVYRQLAKTNSMQTAVKILTSQVGMLENQKGGSLANAFTMDAGNLGKFLQLVRSAIDSVVSVTASPLSNQKAIEYSQSERNVYDESMSTNASSSGVNQRMIFSKDKQTIFESENSLSVDEYLISPVYRELELFLNEMVNKETKKYKFKFMLSGTNFAYDKKRKMSNFTTMANMGIFNPSLAASSMGMNVFDLERMMTQVKAEKWEDKVTMITPMFQQSAEQQAGKGRPQKADEDLSEEGSDTRDSGSNLLKGGKI